LDTAQSSHPERKFRRLSATRSRASSHRDRFSVQACATLLLLLFSTLLVSAECIPFSEAPKHIGATKCVAGKVFKISTLDSGTTFLNFCEDYRTCPFQIVIFRGDLRHIGDIRQLEGRVIEVHGEIKEYDRHAEIILREVGQLQGDAARIPPMPKGFDVEKKGRFSAGKMTHPKSSSQRKKPSRQTPPMQTGETEAD
jgi:hypothetical protein